MSKSLKCWKRVKLQRKDSKQGTVVYANPKNVDRLIIYKVKRAGWFVDRDNPSIGMTLNVKKSKSKALKFAKSWMNRHPKG